MVKPIGVNSYDKNVPTVRQRTIKDGQTGFLIGAGIGAVEGYARKSWIKNDQPTDKFIKQVSKGLTNNLTESEHVELNKVNSFFEALVDPKTNVDSLRGRIEDSTELTNAISKNDGETAKDALDRIFSNPDKNAVKQDLQLMQDKTTVDKKVNKYGAKAVILENFDSANKKLSKSENTSKETFKVLIKAAKKIKLNTAVAHTAIGGVLLGITGLLIGATKQKY